MLSQANYNMTRFHRVYDDQVPYRAGFFVILFSLSTLAGLIPGGDTNTGS